MFNVGVKVANIACAEKIILSGTKKWKDSFLGREDGEIDCDKGNPFIVFFLFIAKVLTCLFLKKLSILSIADCTVWAL